MKGARFVDNLTFKLRFAPSLMCADPLRLREQLEVINRRAALCHVDIMDGHYVPNITLSPQFVAQIRKNVSIPIDAHLMVDNPSCYIDRLAEAGCDYITVHADAIEPCAFRVLRRIKELGLGACVALNPATAVARIYHYADLIDKLTIMTVDAGFVGQSFIPETLRKFGQACELRRERGLGFFIEADGSCNAGTFGRLKEAGCDIYVVGTSGLFSLDEDLDAAFDKLEEVFANARV